MIAKDMNTGSTIPVVDLAEFSDGASSSKARMGVARELVDACRNVGFVYMVNHGIPDELLDQAFAMSKKLFDLKHEEKMLAPHPPTPDWHRGYSSPGLEKVSQVYGKDADPSTVGEKLRETRDCKVRSHGCKSAR